MHSTLRTKRFGRIRSPTAKIVFSVRANAEVGRVAIEPPLNPRLESMISDSVGHGLAPMEKVAVRLHHRPGRAIECFIRTVVKLHCGITVVRRRKSRRRSCDTEQRFEDQ